MDQTIPIPIIPIKWQYPTSLVNLVPRCNEPTNLSQSYLLLQQILESRQNVREPKLAPIYTQSCLLSPQLMKKEPTHTFKLYGKQKIEGQQLRMANSYKKRLDRSNILGDSSPVDTIKREDDMLSMVKFNAMQVRAQGIYRERIKPLADFAQVRANRVKDCEDAGMFFKEVQFVVDTDTKLDVKESGLVGLVAEFPIIRQIRGDGNCLYSAIGFAFIEALLTCPTDDYLKQLIQDLHDAKLAMQDIYLKPDEQAQRVLIIPSQISQPLLADLFRQIYVFRQQFRKGNKALLMYHFMQQVLVRLNEVKGLYDLLIAFMRSVALVSLELNRYREPFSNFIAGEQDIRQRIETMEEEGDFLITYLICEILPLNVSLIQWDAGDALHSIQRVQCKKQAIGEVNLKYIPAHYDLVYSRSMAEQWYEYNTSFELLEEGYCTLCENYLETKLIRIKKCSHCFCLLTDHFQQNNESQEFKCPQHQCTAQLPSKILKEFLGILDKSYDSELIKFDPLY